MDHAMNPDVKAQWTAALRSGEYEQGMGYLNRDNKLCCLGVLCELAVKAGVKVEVTEGSDGGAPFRAYDDNSGYPPPAVQEWARLNTPNPTVLIDGETSALAEFNDSGKSFAQIADAIDACL